MDKVVELLVEGVEIKELDRRVSISDLIRVYVNSYNLISASVKLRALRTLARTDIRVADVVERLNKVNKRVRELDKKKKEEGLTNKEVQEYYRLQVQRRELEDELWEKLPEYRALRDTYRDIRKQASRALREHFGLTPKAVEPIVQMELEVIRNNMGMTAPDGADSGEKVEEKKEEVEKVEGEGVAESATSPLSFFALISLH